MPWIWLNLGNFLNVKQGTALFFLWPLGPVTSGSRRAWCAALCHTLVSAPTLSAFYKLTIVNIPIEIILGGLTVCSSVYRTVWGDPGADRRWVWLQEAGSGRQEARL